MKKIVYILILFQSLTGAVWAQSYTTTTRHNYTLSDIVDSTIVRTYNDTVILTCCHFRGSVQSYSHQFLLRYSRTQSPRVLKLPRLNNSYGEECYRITDMRIWNDTCYFCGKCEYIERIDHVYDLDNHIHYYPVVTTRGFMGYFSIPSALTTDTTSIYLKKLSGVADARRMTVYIQGGWGTGITILGELHGGTQQTCLVEMHKTVVHPHEWTYFKEYLTNTDDTLTDVIEVDGELVVSSVLAEDKDIVGFRHVKVSDGGFYNGDPATKNNLYKYNIRDFVCNDCHLYAGFCRHEGHPVLMCPAAGDFVAAINGSYYGVDGCFEPAGYTLLLRMISPNNMGDVLAVECGNHIKVKELTHLPSSNVTEVLIKHCWHEWLDSAYTMLHSALWGTMPVGQSYTYTVLRQSDGDFHSIDNYRGHSVSLSGRYWSSTPFEGVQRYYDHFNSCYTVHWPGYIHTCRMPTIGYELELEEWKHSDNTTDTWGRVQCTTSPSATTHCSH